MTEHITATKPAVVVQKFQSFAFAWPARNCAGYGVNFPDRIVLCIEPGGECVTLDHAALAAAGVKIETTFMVPGLHETLEVQRPELCGWIKPEDSP